MPNISVQQQYRFQQHKIRVLRSNIARALPSESIRMMICRITDRPLLPWFCHIDRLKVPSKSALQRYADWLSSEQMRPIINRRLGRAALTATAQALQLLGDGVRRQLQLSLRSRKVQVLGLTCARIKRKRL